MIKLTKHNKKLIELYYELDKVASKILEKHDAIERYAMERKRDMTKCEQLRYDELDKELDDICESMEYITSAISSIENYQ